MGKRNPWNKNTRQNIKVETSENTESLRKNEYSGPSQGEENEFLFDEEILPADEDFTGTADAVISQINLSNFQSGNIWTFAEEKAFETAVAEGFDDSNDDHWMRISSKLPNKTVDELKQHFKDLMDDLSNIASGKIQQRATAAETPSPNAVGASNEGVYGGNKKVSPNGLKKNGNSGKNSGVQGGKTSEQERRKGIPWTEEEHR